MASTITPPAVIIIKTVTIDPQATVNATSAGPEKDQANAPPSCEDVGGFPYWAAVCNSRERFWSACTCIGASMTTFTASTPSSITTVTMVPPSPVSTLVGSSGSPLTAVPTTNDDNGFSTGTVIPTSPITRTDSSPVSLSASGSTPESVTAPTAASTTASVNVPVLLAVVPSIPQPTDNNRKRDSRSLRGRKDTPGGFIDLSGTADICSDGTSFNITNDGQLITSDRIVSMRFGERFKQLTSSDEERGISTVFLVVNKILRWQNPVFAGGEAGFCQIINSGKVYATFTSPDSWPPGSQSISIRVYKARQCRNGVIVPDEPEDDSASTVSSREASLISTISTSSALSAATYPSPSYTSKSPDFSPSPKSESVTIASSTSPEGVNTTSQFTTQTTLESTAPSMGFSTSGITFSATVSTPFIVSDPLVPSTSLTSLASSESLTSMISVSPSTITSTMASSSSSTSFSTPSSVSDLTSSTSASITTISSASSSPSSSTSSIGSESASSGFSSVTESASSTFASLTSITTASSSATATASNTATPARAEPFCLVLDSPVYNTEDGQLLYTGPGLHSFPTGVFMDRPNAIPRPAAKFELNDDMSRLLLYGSELAPVAVRAYNFDGARVVELVDVKIIDAGNLSAGSAEVKCSIAPRTSGSGPARDPATGALVPGTLITCTASIGSSTYGPTVTTAPPHELDLFIGVSQANMHFRAGYGVTCDPSRANR